MKSLDIMNVHNLSLRHCLDLIFALLSLKGRLQEVKKKKKISNL